MKTLLLYYVEMENFASFKHLTQISLSTNAGLKFITGSNLKEPQLGSNGAGKTKLWSAVCWCLYGLSLNEHRAADVVTWDEKSPRAMVGLQVDGQEHTIERVGSPNRLYHNGQICTQDQVLALVGLSRARFIHSVIFGQAAKLFYDLSIADRGALVDEISESFDTWTQLSDSAHKQHSIAVKELKPIVDGINFLNGRLNALQGGLAAIKTNYDQWENSRRLDIDRRITEIETLEHELAGHRSDLSEVNEYLTDVPDTVALQKEIDKYRTMQNTCYVELQVARHTAAEAAEQEEFFRVNNVCPKCRQVIHDTVKQRKRLELASKVYMHNEKIQQWERNLKDQTNAFNEATRLLNETSQWLLDNHRRKTQLDTTISLLEQRIARAVTDVEALGSRTHNPFSDSLTDANKGIAETTDRLAADTAKKYELYTKIAHLDFWRGGFKRLRLFMVKQMLLLLEIETANAASSLGLINWQILFSTEMETKSGTIKSGVHITVIEPNGHTVTDESGGEEQRIRLAIALGMSSLIQQMAGVDIKVEVFDEPSAWLSPEGIDSLLTTLSNRAESSGKSIWLLDHRVLSYGNFTERWCIEKDIDGYSRIYMEDG